jgi:hypothetical protein
MNWRLRITWMMDHPYDSKSASMFSKEQLYVISGAVYWFAVVNFYAQYS